MNLEKLAKRKYAFCQEILSRYLEKEIEKEDLWNLGTMGHPKDTDQILIWNRIYLGELSYLIDKDGHITISFTPYVLTEGLPEMFDMDEQGVIDIPNGTFDKK